MSTEGNSDREQPQFGQGPRTSHAFRKPLSGALGPCDKLLRRWLELREEGGVGNPRWRNEQTHTRCRSLIAAFVSRCDLPIRTRPEALGQATSLDTKQPPRLFEGV